MKQPAAWLAGALGVAGLWRLLRRRRGRGPAPVEAPPAGDPAQALRAKLAETREAEPEPEPSPEAASLEERRRAVHDAGRAAIDEMRSSGGDEGSPGPGSE
ncbi:MAG: hypothetical protein HY511_06475 [Actinobacteria bacterium]|nr:hypothetical protein [Actinomycetota bacterium]